MPSDQGHYRTLIRVLTPEHAAPWVIKKEPWLTVPDWQINPAMIGSQVRKTFDTALQHRIITVLQIGKAGSANTALQDANLISSSGSIGGCATTFCVVTAKANAILRSSVKYTTPETMQAKTRHLITDLDTGQCYAVTSSISGTIVSGKKVNANDNTLLFTVPSAGAQQISVVSC